MGLVLSLYPRQVEMGVTIFNRLLWGDEEMIGNIKVEKRLRPGGLQGKNPARGLVEYALILLLIAVAVSAGLRGIGPAVAGDFDRARDALN